MPRTERTFRTFGHIVAALYALSFLTDAVQAQSAEDFFKKADKLTMYVGSSAGAGYDQIARLVGRHLSRFLPGHPPFVFEYMPTAVGIQATNNAAVKRLSDKYD